MLTTAALHAALLALLMAPPRHRAESPAGVALDAIQWLLPAPARPAARAATPPPEAMRPQPSRRERAPATARPTTDRAPALAATPVQDAAPGSAAPPADNATGDLTAPGQPAPTLEQLLRQPGRGAGRIDHELRGGKRDKLVAPADTLQAGLERGFREAAAAVLPKWYEPAVLEEISTPSSRVRVYKMKTALGVVCVSAPDPSLEKRATYIITNCPREK
ncbi:hypothetical protein [Pseudoduganella namucuonensis]|uniref:hypothetical protein n=1 Tax=Pseudoduganella namucuonensis TaxID=1035707 RepID=UPI000B888C91|nr:hypothetical protein [Pseudoduganella namucuonensis]